MAAISAGDGRLDGKFFEECFERFARYCGLFPKKTELSARRIANGRVITLKSDLDYRLANRQGRVGYFDCKNFKGARFEFSDIDEDQLDRAVELNEWNVPAGFVVWFRGVNRISFFSGLRIRSGGHRTSFGPADGLPLGSLETFDLKPLLPLSAASNR